MNKEEQQNAFIEAIEYYKTQSLPLTQDMLVELLREIQDIYEYIPLDAQESISSEFGLPTTLISKIIKLYPSLKSINYRHKITMCCGPRCGNKNAASVLSALEKELNIKKGEVTKDGRFALLTINCMKKCKTSPNLTINEDAYTYVTPVEIPTILKQYH